MTIRRLLQLTALTILAAIFPAQAQTFEVATVKPVDADKMTMVELRIYPGGRLIIHGYNLHGLIAAAFNIPGWQITGGEKWIDQQRFDLEAKPPADSKNASTQGEFSNGGIQNPAIRTMLQALLIDRFHLTFHKTSQPGTIYQLQRGTNPLQLKVAELSLYKKADDGSMTQTNAYPSGDIGLVEGRPVSFHQTSMQQLAGMLSNFQRAPVSDRTGLPDYYNFQSQTVVTKEDFQDGGPVHLLIEAVPEMGLKLVKMEGLVEKFVIDHAEAPGAN